MSTLTKILIVLLTISSIFLCGIVVTYVGSATNYKKSYEDRKRDIDSLRTENSNLKDQITGLNGTLSTEAEKHTSAIDKLQSEIGQITTERDQYKIELENTGRRLKRTRQY